ncbi:NAD-dependent epimerase [Saccharococcus caldoxylosilyticus]|uniref:Putative UDP-galacturonate 4-epimerase n=1 Tax=Parageobacillus caldoxylosilyticus NBRC 107762 TaxID=1220594 RepID=A0A023DBK8_9BACL|nr:NAD-dependent epimerase [Parageobacillus caldoxylosilyticus]MBB3851071.1 UDP-glucuronate 4-epimerase [Parageobacillus caldoxylosilyticus]GAJ38351.1 putative UDP-galacturonate 4-epimerase [Parageobacillus caldoxylosilyticus NBRC 107762]
MTILVTGAAGFIGMHLSQRLLEQGYEVVGIDNLNDYYDPKLKEDRLAELRKYDRFTFEKLDLVDREGILKLFEKFSFTHVIHLAAQAGVRYSLQNPHAYVDSNLVGFVNILEACRHYPVKHFIYASSSSVYGANAKMPFSTNDNVDHPVSLYAATKKANELIAHTYSHLYGIPTTGLRFFTVYGPWGRPDMAYFSFTKHILEGKPIKVFNHGNMKRDFTYIDDIIEGMICLLDKPPIANPNWDRMSPDPSSSYAPYKIYNIGNNQPVKLLDFIETLESLLGIKAKMEFLPMQPGDVEATYADIDDLQKAVGFHPSTSIEDGLKKFVDWYRGYYG